MNILIVGAGSVGIYLGTLLNSKGHNVILLGRKKLKRINKTVFINKQAYPIPQKIYSFPKNKSYDFIFVTSKLYDLENNLKKIVVNHLETKYLLLIQNGIIEDEIYEQYTKKFNFSSISIFEGFRIIGNQLTTNKTKAGWKTDTSKVGIETAKLLQNAGIPCSIEKNLNSIKAEKAIMNCSTNILSAITKKTLLELYQNQSTKKMMDELFNESYVVLSKEYKLKSKEELQKLFYQAVQSMNHHSSTYQDVISNKKTEVQFLNGLVVKLAKKHKLQAPANQKILKIFLKKYPRLK